jgi:site-specific recombinase XerD
LSKQGPRGVFEKDKGSGVWWTRYHDQFGKLHREKVGPKSLAIKAYQKRKTEIREGKFFPEKLKKSRELSFREMAKLYLDDHSKINKVSYRTDQHRMVRLLKKFGDQPLSEISRHDVERFRASLAGELAPSTVNRYMALLKSVFNKAISWGKAEKNPVQGLKQFKESQRTRYLTEEEEGRLRAVFPPKHWPLVEIAVNTGMRRSEQFGLQWDNVNFNSEFITIPRSKHGEVRHIPMNKTVQKIFQELPSRLRSKWVFPSGNIETPMDIRNFVHRIFLPADSKANIKDFRWHDLRHTFASRLAMSGENLRTVQELMGHKTISMTMKYSHLSPSHLKDAVGRLDRKPTDTSTDTSQDTK